LVVSQDPIVVADEVRRGPQVEIDWAKEMAEHMTRSYEHVRERQKAYAEANQRRRATKAIPVEFKVRDEANNVNGDSVLHWEPQQTTKLFSEHDDTEVDTFKVNQRQLALHDFDLTKSGYIPLTIQRPISSHPNV